MLSRPGWMLRRNDQPPNIWDTHGLSGNVVVNPLASSSSHYPGGFNPWISNVTEHISPHVTSERPTPDTTLDPRCQSGPSARNSFDPNQGRFSKDCVADQQRLQISDLHFDKFPHTSNVCLLEDKIQDGGMYLFTISYGSHVVDQRSGDGWISGWSQIFALYQRNSNTRFWVIRCKDCFSIEQESSIIPRSQKKGQSGGTEIPKVGLVTPRKTDRSLDLRILQGHSNQWVCREVCGLVCSCIA